MSQRTKLLLLIPHLGGGGAEQVTSQLAQHLDPNRFEIHLCAITNDAPGARHPPPWVTLHRLRCQRVRQAWLKLIQLIRTEQPDVVLSNMAHLNFLVLASRPFLPRQTRIFVRQNTTASASARSWLSRLFYLHLYPHADAILCQSEAMARDLVRSFAIPQEKVRVVANPVDTSAISTVLAISAASATHSINAEDPAIPDHAPHSGQIPVSPVSAEIFAGRGPRLLTIARLANEKGIDLILHAIPEIKRRYPKVHLEILGTGPEEASLRKLLSSLNLESSVSFRGYVLDPWLHYPQATLFVMPSRREGMPNALLEAAAAGLPIVATPCSEGLQDLLTGAPGTWISSHVSAQSLTKTLLAAIDTLAASPIQPPRFEHSFLAPFEQKTAIAAYETLLSDPAETQSKLRIALLLPTIDRIGGAERQVLLLAKELAARGHSVTVIALSGCGATSALELTLAGVEFLSLEMRKAWVDPRAWLRYTAWAIQARPQILHAHLPHATWFARCTRLIIPVRVLIDTIHTSHAGSHSRQVGYRVTSFLTNHVTCVSQSVAATAIGSKLTSMPNLSILPNGVILPSPRVTPALTSPGASHFKWIAVGRLHPVKDYPTLLRAFAALSGGPQLQVVGVGANSSSNPGQATDSYEQSLRSLAQQLGIESRVHFTGFQRNIQPLLASSDAFVLSSLWEGLPISVLEASAASLPVVVTNGKGTQEAIIPGKTGLLVPVGNVQALSQAMQEIMSTSSEQRELMGACGRKFVEEHFTISEIANRWESLYFNLRATHPRPKRWSSLPRVNPVAKEVSPLSSAPNASGISCPPSSGREQAGTGTAFLQSRL